MTRTTTLLRAMLKRTMQRVTAFYDELSDAA